MGTKFLFRKMEANSRNFPAELDLAQAQGSGKSCYQSLGWCQSLPQECQAARGLCLEEPRGPDLELETPDCILKKVVGGRGGNKILPSSQEPKD